MSRVPDSALDDLKARHPVDVLAGQWVKLRARRNAAKGFSHAGPCPLCSSGKSKGDDRFACGPDKWACAACGRGGDVIALYAAYHGLDMKRDFARIVDELGGVARAAEETPAVAQRAGRAAFARGAPRQPPAEFGAQPSLREGWCEGFDKAQAQAVANERYRERERKRLHDYFWEKAAPWQGSPVARYLTLRGLMVPPHAKLRYLADAPYFRNGDEIEPAVLHRGPAMLAAIRDAAGVFRGLHFTWIDVSAKAASRNYKAAIVDPDSGELLKAKKSRGSKQGGYIDLGGHPLRRALKAGSDFPGDRGAPVFDRQFSGEGIESTLAVHTAMVRGGRDIAGIAWRCGIDLGNLCGAAADSEKHPTRKVPVRDKATGEVKYERAARVPGRTPDMTSAAMPVIAGCRDYVQLGDGDSDPFTTQCAMARGEARRRAEGIPVRTLWPPAGMDFNDWLLTVRNNCAKAE